jgi:hypothetical protein
LNQHGHGSFVVEKEMLGVANSFAAVVSLFLVAFEAVFESTCSHHMAEQVLKKHPAL